MTIYDLLDKISYLIDTLTSEEEDASSEMTFEARTEAVKKVWMRELRKKTEKIFDGIESTRGNNDNKLAVLLE